MQQLENRVNRTPNDGDITRIFIKSETGLDT